MILTLHSYLGKFTKFRNLSNKNIKFSKFWKTLSSLFGKKSKNQSENNLTDINVSVTSDVEIAKTFKEYFDEILSNLNIIQNECYIRKTGNIEDAVKKHHCCKYLYHPSIANIKYIMKSKTISSFSFQPVSIEKVKDTIKILNTEKACRTTIYLRSL